jgi:hypothetical protein
VLVGVADKVGVGVDVFVHVKLGDGVGVVKLTFPNINKS